jgi:hypothetical protein
MYASAAEETVTFFPVSDGLELSLFVNRELPRAIIPRSLRLLAFCGNGDLRRTSLFG